MKCGGATLQRWAARAVGAAARRPSSLSHLPPLRGVVFDMDGTLTIPAIDFALMNRAVLGDEHPRIVSGSPIDILHEIEAWPPHQQDLAYRIIASFEQDALERLQIMPGASDLCKFLDARRIRRGLITRNVKTSVDLFHLRFGIGEFYPALSREFRPCKPSPAPLLHICHSWGVLPSQVLMVGDSAMEDVVCGNRAGAATCLLDEKDYYDVAKLPHIYRNVQRSATNRPRSTRNGPRSPRNGPTSARNGGNELVNARNEIGNKPISVGNKPLSVGNNARNKLVSARNKTRNEPVNVAISVGNETRNEPINVGKEAGN